MTNGKSDTKVPPGSRTGPETRWTVLVFMGAGEVPGAASLKTAADDDLEEMKLIGSGFNQVEEASGDDVAPSSSVCLEVLVQAYGLFEVPKRGRVEQGHIEWTDVPEGDRQAEGGRSLERFVNWGVTASGHGDSNPNHHMMLVLWGHSFDFVFGPGRRQNGTVDALDFAELSDALERSLNRAGADEQARLKQSTPVESKFDIVAFDSCDVSTVEIAYQFAPFADYLIASQVGVPLPGWPYNRILERLRYPIGRPMGPTELGAFIVERFCESYNAGRPVSLTLLDLGRAQELFDRAGELANGLGAVMANPERRRGLLDVFSRSQTNLGRPVRGPRRPVRFPRSPLGQPAGHRSGDGSRRFPRQPAAAPRRQERRWRRQGFHRRVRTQRRSDGAPERSQHLCAAGGAWARLRACPNALPQLSLRAEHPLERYRPRTGAAVGAATTATDATGSRHDGTAAAKHQAGE